MQITVSGKNMDSGSAFQDHANTQLDAVVSKYFPRAVSGKVTLEKDTIGFAVKIYVVLTTGMDMEASGKAGDAKQAMDIAAEHIEKRLRRYKRRLKNHHQDHHEQDFMAATMTVLSYDKDDTSPASDTASIDDADADTGGENGAPAILAEMDYSIQSLSLEEAIMRFDISGQSAMMFRNKSHMGLNMIYRRNDNSIGWVDPRGNR
ncbi:MAG TPA: ribosome-associated translation inhibitor RaiA [Alphaproteobacteria bacterium]|nr:ribosome-associated translation inhibitor RaiA [Alphaproteobacteria bacterium]